MSVRIYRRYHFAASHVLPLHKGQCAKLHGHNWTATLCLSGPVWWDGMVFDFDELDASLGATIQSELDHKHLNELMEHPTCENIAAWIYRKADALFSDNASIYVVSVTVSECADAWAEYPGGR